VTEDLTDREREEIRERLGLRAGEEITWEAAPDHIAPTDPWWGQAIEPKFFRLHTDRTLYVTHLVGTPSRICYAPT
jgi:hypothetical protein